MAGAKGQKTLAQLSVFEFYQLIQSFSGAPVLNVRNEVRSVTGRVRAVTDKLVRLLPYAEKISDKELNAMESQVLELLEKIRAMR